MATKLSTKAYDKLVARQDAARAMLAALEAGQERIQISINALTANNAASVCAIELRAVRAEQRSAIAAAKAAGIEAGK